MARASRRNTASRETPAGSRTSSRKRSNTAPRSASGTRVNRCHKVSPSRERAAARSPWSAPRSPRSKPATLRRNPSEASSKYGMPGPPRWRVTQVAPAGMNASRSPTWKATHPIWTRNTPSPFSSTLRVYSQPRSTARAEGVSTTNSRAGAQMKACSSPRSRASRLPPAVRNTEFAECPAVPLRRRAHQPVVTGVTQGIAPGGLARQQHRLHHIEGGIRLPLVHPREARRFAQYGGCGAVRPRPRCAWMHKAEPYAWSFYIFLRFSTRPRTIRGAGAFACQPVMFYRRKLPHWHPDDLAEATFLFVTWRLAGSIPRTRLPQPPTAAPRSGSRAFLALDREVDKAAFAPVWLPDDRVARVVTDALLYGESGRHFYPLRAWVIMPNPVNVLLRPETSLPVITRWLKGSTARQANLILVL